ncbi:hypothetical protein Ssi03_46810 [Sphaerisporangium siamense]|uniref:Uncharacterized protein (DUF433 family) n=1 Tax=Sphaerisporangium siamense TaxID=795645 RepID=A0A7W7D2Q3_9ACTN|nr:DUF433 domain-containing protein [Sphaerisporangium siamense]MBB4699182.1 uncharacterized protein (DUF433 family) [Sphaerisporangium siamense]GII86691.1 hypothetical protein Ssi03_46810 [Sphaerisporangium siamense]
MSDIQVLARRVMSVREAARQLRIPPTTLLHWLEGEERQGRFYPPVLREQPTGATDVTWGEIVEARYLRAYRQRNVSMQKLRPFIALLRSEFGVPYPLAHFKPFVDNRRRFLLEVQDRLHIPGSLRMVYQVDDDQLVLDHRVVDFLDRVDFNETGEREAQRIHPLGRSNPVVIDPLLSSAAATVQGVRTEVLAELADAQVPVEEIADDFDLPVAAVKAALAFEWSADAA